MQESKAVAVGLLFGSVDTHPRSQAWIPQAIVVPPPGRMMDVRRGWWEVERDSPAMQNPSSCTAHTANIEWKSEGQRSVEVVSGSISVAMGNVTIPHGNTQQTSVAVGQMGAFEDLLR